MRWRGDEAVVFAKRLGFFGDCMDKQSPNAKNSPRLYGSHKGVLQ